MVSPAIIPLLLQLRRLGCHDSLRLLDGLLKMRVHGCGFSSSMARNLSYPDAALASAAFVGDASGEGREVAVAQTEKVVELGDPVAHGHGFAAAGRSSAKSR